MASFLRFRHVFNSVTRISGIRSFTYRTNFGDIKRCFYEYLVKGDVYIPFWNTNRFLATLGRVQHETTTEEERLSPQARLHSLDKALYRLDLDVRKLGRIARKDVEDIFAEIKYIGTSSSTQSLLLIRCCGSLLPDELPEARTKLVNEIWDKLVELNCQMDVSHYNALLKVYLENEYKFSPTEFLKTMENKGIQPNRVTYQRLITRYCQEGDIEGARKVLEFMKKEELPINESVFNSLIIGHARANDMENAKNILEVMRNAQLEPGCDTYCALLCGYAEKGQIDEMRKIFQEAENNDVYFMDRDILDIVYTLAVNGHSMYIDEVLGKIRKLAGYNQDCINIILKLVNNQQEDTGYKLLKTMPRTSLPDGKFAPAGNFFIRQMVRCEVASSKILDICKDMKKAGLNETPVLKATENALVYQKKDHALQFIDELHKEGMPVRCHYFWPIFVALSKQKDENAIYSVLKKMIEYGCPANYETLTDYVLHCLNISDPNVVVEKMKELGMTVGSVINPLIYILLDKNETSQAAVLIDQYPVRLNAILLTKALATSCKNTGDLESTLKILQHLTDNPERLADTVQSVDWCGQFLLDYLSACQNNTDTIENVLNRMVEKDMKISHNTVDIILNRIKDGINDNITTLLEQMATSNLQVAPDDIDSATVAHPRDMNVEELENHLLELKSKGMNTRGVLRRLLMLHCRKKNVDRAQQIITELEEVNFSFTPAMYAQIMELHISNENLEEALKCKKIIDETDKNFAIDSHKILNLATLLTERNRYQEALEIIKNHYSNFGVKESKDFLQRNVWRLLTAVANTGSVERTRELFHTVVIECGFTTPTNMVLGPLMKVHIDNDNLSAAVEEFKEIAKRFQQTPWKGELFRKLIQLEDSESLQKVMDLSSEVHGEMNTLYDLACCFIECGRVKQAKKILETPGLRARNRRLEAFCERYLQQNMITELEDLVNITRDLFDIDRDQMYYYLLCGYAKLNDVKKALAVWTSMQDENVQPRAKTLRFLAEFLQKNGEEVPFVIPELQSEKSHNGKISFMDYIKAEDVDKALEYKRSMEDRGEKLNLMMSTVLIEALLRKDRLLEATNVSQELFRQQMFPKPQVLKFLLNRLARAGDVETIKNMRPVLPLSVLKLVSFDNFLANAYINSNRSKELLAELGKDLSESKNKFPSGGILGVMKKHPELENEIVQLTEKYANQEQFFIPKNMLWMHYFTEEEYDKANQIFQSCPEMKERIMFGNILSKAREDNNETMARKLVDLILECDVSTRTIGVACSCLIDILTNTQKNEEGLAVLQEFQDKKNLKLSDFNRSSLVRLKTNLLQEGLQVPFEVPEQQSRSQEDSSSDSSDDEQR